MSQASNRRVKFGWILSGAVFAAGGAFLSIRQPVPMSSTRCGLLLRGSGVALRRTLHVSLEDLLAVVREFLNPDASRSGLDRCLRRHGVGNLRDLKAKEARPKRSGFKAYEPGYIHIDVKYLPHLFGECRHSPARQRMADETSRRSLFVAIDHATRWVFVRVYNA